MAKKLNRREALEVLGLDEGATEKEIKMQFKKLALRWHPDKNPDDPVAAEAKFQKLSAAYSHLKEEDEESDEEYDAVSLAELLIELFGGRFFQYEPPVYCSCHHCFHPSDWREDRHRMMREDEPTYFGRDPRSKVVGDRLVKEFADKLYNNFNQPSRAYKKDNFSTSGISPAEASRNAEQLLEDEEKAKREKQKKKDRNKKKKEAKKKRKAKEFVSAKDKSEASFERKPEPELQQDSASQDSENEFDVTSSAFFARANKKTPSSKPKAQPRDSLSNNGTISSSSLQSSEEQSGIPPTPDTERTEIDLAQSRKLASLGNRAAKDGHFEEAVRRYNEAITLYPFDHRYFGNRSFCFELLEDYKSALEDADKAIQLDKTWAKGYYRQGKAYAGLKKLDLAESSFVSALQFDPNYQEASEELHRIRVDQLIMMGFPQDLCEPAVKEFGTVQASIDAIVAGKVLKAAPVKDESLEMQPPAKPPQYNGKQRHKLPPRMRAMASQPPQPKHDRTSASDDKRVLWVGNIIKDTVTEDILAELFQNYGEVSSVRLLFDRHCAFINYKKPGSAAQALKELQGYNLEGCYLLLRYPETSGKNTYMSEMRKPGPVNGNECYYWRTTGCHYGLKCHYEHIPENKGIDLPAMM